MAFYNLRLLDNKKEIQKLQEGMLKYCELNIWAKMRVLEKLKIFSDY